MLAEQREYFLKVPVENFAREPLRSAYFNNLKSRNTSAWNENIFPVVPLHNIHNIFTSQILDKFAAKNKLIKIIYPAVRFH